MMPEREIHKNISSLLAIHDQSGVETLENHA
jgi:hypothetical protein